MTCLCFGNKHQKLLLCSASEDRIHIWNVTKGYRNYISDCHGNNLFQNLPYNNNNGGDCGDKDDYDYYINRSDRASDYCADGLGTNPSQTITQDL